jgi:hypothetical protein
LIGRTPVRNADLHVSLFDLLDIKPVVREQLRQKLREQFVASDKSTHANMMNGFIFNRIGVNQTSRDKIIHHEKTVRFPLTIYCLEFGLRFPQQLSHKASQHATIVNAPAIGCSVVIKYM